MAEFKILRNVSKNFEKDICKLRNELSCIKIESIEDIVAKKNRDIALFKSKLRLLRAVPLAETPQVVSLNKNEHTINDYTDTVDWKIIEQQIVKTLTQTRIIKNLITLPNWTLDPVLVEKKEHVIKKLMEYREKEAEFRQLEALLQEKEDQLLHSRQAWDETLWNFKDESLKIPQTGEVATGRMYNHVRVLVNKMELMRWLMSKIVMARTVHYDWITDPHNRLNALALTRKRHTINDYTEHLL